jgi:hypothetical protein
MLDRYLKGEIDIEIYKRSLDLLHGKHREFDDKAYATNGQDHVFGYDNVARGYDLVVMISASQAGHTGSNPVTRIRTKSIGLTYRINKGKILL